MKVFERQCIQKSTKRQLVLLATLRQGERLPSLRCGLGAGAAQALESGGQAHGTVRPAASSSCETAGVKSRGFFLFFLKLLRTQQTCQQKQKVVGLTLCCSVCSG